MNDYKVTTSLAIPSGSEVRILGFGIKSPIPDSIGSSPLLPAGSIAMVWSGLNLSHETRCRIESLIAKEVERANGNLEFCGASSRR